MQMVGDALESAMDDVEDEEESDQIVNQVLDEIGINLNDSLVDAPGKKQEEAKIAENDADKELEARLNNLKR